MLGFNQRGVRRDATAFFRPFILPKVERTCFMFGSMTHEDKSVRDRKLYFVSRYKLLVANGLSLQATR